MFKKIRSSVLPFILALLLLCLCACGRGADHVATGTDGATAAAVDYSAAEQLGEGNTRFWYSVTLAAGMVTEPPSRAICRGRHCSRSM